MTDVYVTSYTLSFTTVDAEEYDFEVDREELEEIIRKACDALGMIRPPALQDEVDRDRIAEGEQ